MKTPRILNIGMLMLFISCCTSLCLASDCNYSQWEDATSYQVEKKCKTRTADPACPHGSGQTEDVILQLADKGYSQKRLSRNSDEFYLTPNCQARCRSLAVGWAKQDGQRRYAISYIRWSDTLATSSGQVPAELKCSVAGGMVRLIHRAPENGVPHGIARYDNLQQCRDQILSSDALPAEIKARLSEFLPGDSCHDWWDHDDKECLE